MTHAGQLLKRKVYCCILLNAILSVRKKKTQMTLIKFKREIILPNQQKLWYYSGVTQQDLKGDVIIPQNHTA